MLNLKILFSFLIYSMNIYCIYGKNEIKIGAIFHPDNLETEAVFLSAIDEINTSQRAVELKPIIKRITRDNGFKAEKEVCDLASSGVAAIFGPFSHETVGIVESVTSRLGIPHISAYWHPEPLEVIDRPKKMTVNFYPESNLFANGLRDLVKDNDWKGFTVLYETDEGLMRLKDTLQTHGPTDRPIIVRQLDSSGDYRPLLKEIKNGVGDFIVDCNIENILNFLNDASSLNMSGEYHRYIFTHMDTHSLKFNEAHVQSNLTTIRLVDPKKNNNRHIVGDWIQYQRRFNHLYPEISEIPHLEPSLIYDAVKLFSEVLIDFNSIEEIFVPSMDCRNEHNEFSWDLGLDIVTKLKKLEDKVGISGPIEFNEKGQRSFFEYEIIELSKQGFGKIGMWNPVDKIQHTRDEREVTKISNDQLSEKVVRVVSKTGEPFLFVKEGDHLEGNARYEGYNMDLIEEISKILNFTYVVELVPDGKYGNYDPKTQEWNGIVRHIMEAKADIGICDLTVTYERRTAVDFTSPFMTLGISILYAKPNHIPPDLFSFLLPLSVDVWLYTAMAYMLISFLIFILARISPDEWESVHPCNKDEEETENIWNAKNSSWVTVGSIMGQGSDILPKAVSTRIVTGLYWFFALIMLASYTANMAAFLTMERMDSSIESVEELAQQSEVKYGAVEGGSTLSFFKNSNNSLYQKMYTVMIGQKPSVFPKDNKQAADRVAKSKRMYAFFIESAVLEYIIERNCNLRQIGGLLDSKSYAIALPMHSAYRKLINKAILKLQEHGKLESLKKKWWKEMKGGGACVMDKKVDNPELGVANVGGVFVVLLGGCLTGLSIGICEFLWNVRKVAVHERLTPFEALKQEVKFACQINVTTKPVHKKFTNSPNASKANSRRSSVRSTARRSIRSRSRSRIKHSEP